MRIYFCYFTATRALLLLIQIIAIAQQSQAQFVGTKNTEFTLNEKPFRFAGTNNYYLLYKPKSVVDDLLNTAAARNFSVIRTWAFLDIGHQDGSGSVDPNGIKEGVYLQYWSDQEKRPVYNDTNFAYLDYVIYKASSLGIKLILTLTNNWQDFGGMDQYVQWRIWQSSSFQAFHDQFYIDPLIIQWYKDYITHVLQRKNTFSGVTYLSDPTILAWELANEPRCQGSGHFSSTNNCTLNYAIYGKDPVAWKITAWVSEISNFIKSIDKNHLVAVGDEGFFCERYQTCPDVTCDCYYGTDAINFTKIPSIDFMSLHLYPDQWGKDANWGVNWIKQHVDSAHNDIQKPVVLGEFGSRDGNLFLNNKVSAQHDTYQLWTDTIFSSGMNGDLFWMLAAHDENGQWYQNYDGYEVYCPTDGESTPGHDPQSCPVLSAHAQKMLS